MNTRLVMTLVATVAVLGCEIDQDLGPDSKMQIDFALDADEAQSSVVNAPHSSCVSRRVLPSMSSNSASARVKLPCRHIRRQRRHRAAYPKLRRAID